MAEALPFTGTEPGTLGRPVGRARQGVGVCSAVGPDLVPLSRGQRLAPPDAAQQNRMISRPDAARVLRAIGRATLGTGLLVA
jgi:hypothetical protein